jgi:hypothetical protein
MLAGLTRRKLSGIIAAASAKTLAGVPRGIQYREDSPTPYLY